MTKNLFSKRSGVERNQVGDTAKIYVYDVIGIDFTSKQFCQQLDALAGVQNLDIRINSPGGLATDGIAIYSALNRFPAEKSVSVEGAAFSIASIVALAASPGKLSMVFNSRMMIHKGWDITGGNEDDHLAAAARLKMLDGQLAATYAKRATSLSTDDLLAMMKAETYLTPDECVAMGLADSIEDPAADDEFDGAQNFDHAMAMKFDPADVARYKRMPADVRAMFVRDTKENDVEIEERARERARVEMAYRWAELRAAG